MPTCKLFSLYSLLVLGFIKVILNSAVDAMDMPLLNAYLDSIGAPIFHKGCNFAAAGSTILPATANSISPFSFGVQVAQFFKFKDRVLQLLAKGTRKCSQIITLYLTNGVLVNTRLKSGKTLTLIWTTVAVWSQSMINVFFFLPLLFCLVKIPCLHAFPKH